MTKKNFNLLEARDKHGRTALDLACMQGEAGCVRSLLEAGASCHATTHDHDLDGRTPVHACAYANSLDCLKLIVSARYEERERLANARDARNRTPLMYAAEQGHANMLGFLIAHMDADVLLADQLNRTALHRAAALGYEECCLELLRTNVQTAMQRDINGMMPIHYAVMAGHANLITLFFDYHKLPATPNIRDLKLIDNGGYSLLHFACYNGHSTCVETLCELGMDLTRHYLVEMLFPRSGAQQSIYNRFSPLHCACFNSHSACLAYLLDKFAISSDGVVDLDDNDENTCLHVCAATNEFECAGALIDAGADLNRVNRLGRTPLMVAAVNNSFAVVELLLKRARTGANAATSANGHNKQVLNSTVDIRRSDLDLVDADGNSALHLALANKNENCALFILDEIKEDSPVINAQNKQGDTALHIAAMNGLVTSVEILLNKGGDIWMKNAVSKTPLLACARDNQVAECLELMLTQLMLTVSNNANTPHTPAAPASSVGGSNKQNQTYTPLKPTGIIRSSNNTPQNHHHHHHHHRINGIGHKSTKGATSLTSVGVVIMNHHEAATTPNDTITTEEDSSLLTTTDIILNDVHMNPIGGSSNLGNLTLSNGSLNNLNSTLINNNDDIGDDDDAANASFTIKVNKSFDSVDNLPSSSSIDNEFY